MNRDDGRTRELQNLEEWFWELLEAETEARFDHKCLRTYVSFNTPAKHGSISVTVHETHLKSPRFRWSVTYSSKWSGKYSVYDPIKTPRGNLNVLNEAAARKVAREFNRVRDRYEEELQMLYDKATEGHRSRENHKALETIYSDRSYVNGPYGIREVRGQPASVSADLRINAFSLDQWIALKSAIDDIVVGKYKQTGFQQTLEFKPDHTGGRNY